MAQGRFPREVALRGARQPRHVAARRSRGRVHESRHIRARSRGRALEGVAGAPGVAAGKALSRRPHLAPHIRCVRAGRAVEGVHRCEDLVRVSGFGCEVDG